MTLEEAARFVHIDANELRHFAQRGEVPAIHHEGQWRFEVRYLNEWAQRNLLASDGRGKDDMCRRTVEEGAKTLQVADFFLLEAIDLDIKAKARGGVLRDLVELACQTGLVWESDKLFEALVEREESASTAVGHSFAFPHARFLDRFMYESPFIAYGRSLRGVFFGGPDGEQTRHFFLICSTDHQTHLRVLARLSELVRKTALGELLEAAQTPEEVIASIKTCEKELF